MTGKVTIVFRHILLLLLPPPPPHCSCMDNPLASALSLTNSCNFWRSFSRSASRSMIRCTGSCVSCLIQPGCSALCGEGVGPVVDGGRTMACHTRCEGLVVVCFCIVRWMLCIGGPFTGGVDQQLWNSVPLMLCQIKARPTQRWPISNKKELLALHKNASLVTLNDDTLCTINDCGIARCRRHCRRGGAHLRHLILVRITSHCSLPSSRLLFVNQTSGK